jgi:hypothetical protein
MWLDMPRTVLFVAGGTCNRAYKEATALVDSGAVVHLLHQGFTRGVSSAPFHTVRKYSTAADLVAKAKTFKCDVIHVHNYPDWPVSALVNSDIKKPVILDIHDCPAMTYTPGKSHSHLSKKNAQEQAIRDADGIVTCSSAIIKWVYGTFKKPVTLIPNTTLYNRPEPVEKLSAKDGRVHLVYIGNFYNSGSVPGNMKTMKNLARKHNAVVHIHSHYFRNIIQKHTNKNVILEAGLSQPKIPKVLSRYDMGIILPSSQAHIARHNKAYDYVGAGLPFLVTKRMTEVRGAFGDWAIVMGKWNGTVPTPKTNIQYRMHNHVPKLLKLYRSAIRSYKPRHMRMKADRKMSVTNRRRSLRNYSKRRVTSYRR